MKSLVAEVAAEPVALAMPSWCQYVPSAEKGVSCRGSNAKGCTCDSTCSNIPAGSWGYNPECCGCGKGGATAQAAEMKSLVAEVTAEPVALAMPSWCQYVPSAEKGVSCRGSNAKGCTCDSTCSNIPAGSWAYNPE